MVALLIRTCLIIDSVIVTRNFGNGLKDKGKSTRLSFICKKWNLFFDLKKIKNDVRWYNYARDNRKLKHSKLDTVIRIYLSSKSAEIVSLFVFTNVINVQYCLPSPNVQIDVHTCIQKKAKIFLNVSLILCVHGCHNNIKK